MKRNQKAIKGISTQSNSNKKEAGLLLTGEKGTIVNITDECYNGGIVIQVIR